mgnify:FL=1
MSEEMELARKHVELLTEKRTSREIARFLESEGVRGIRKVGQLCAISAWLREKVPGVHFLTGYGGVQIRQKGTGLGAEYINVDNTPAMATFITAFDRGQYPKLVKEVP